MTHPDGLVAGRYRLGERIGAGAMGVVWRAFDERLGRTVALKQLVLSPVLSPAEAHEAKARIMREGRIAARLHHPNAIVVFDVADHGGTPWLVMEYLPSRSLAAVLADLGPLPPHDVAVIGRQLAAALTAAHAAGIVHRDIKPGNVLLGSADPTAGTGAAVAKLSDFGISRATDDVTVTRTGVVSGTPAYLAPEVARGAQPSVASDVFALGATLYAAVEGQPPFGLHDNPLALLHVVASGQVRPPRQAGPLTALLMQMLRPEPAQRPSMAQVSAALAPGGLATGALPQPRPVPGPMTGSMPGSVAGPMTGTTVMGPVTGPAAGYQGATATRMDLPPVGEPPPQEGATERRPALLVAVGVAFAVLASLFVLAATSGDDDPPAAAPTTSVQPTTTTPPPTTTTTTTPPPTTTTTTRRQASGAELERAVVEYYELLPKRPERAWERLGPSLQAEGYEEYEEFWEDIETVRGVPTATDPASMTVRVFVVYRKDDRRPDAEVRELTLAYSGDTLLIERDSRIGNAEVPTSTTKRRG